MESYAVWLVLLPSAPIIAATIFYPARGLVSDSLADSDSALLPALITLGYALAGALEYWARGRGEGLAVSVPLGLTALSTIDQTLLVDGGECNAWCAAHGAFLLVYIFAELAALWTRGVSAAALAPFAAALFATGAVYRGVVAADGFNADHGPTKSFLYYVGTLQVSAFVAARVFAATAP